MNNSSSKFNENKNMISHYFSPNQPRREESGSRIEFSQPSPYFFAHCSMSLSSTAHGYNHHHASHVTASVHFELVTLVRISLFILLPQHRDQNHCWGDHERRPRRRPWWGCRGDLELGRVGHGGGHVLVHAGPRLQLLRHVLCKVGNFKLSFRYLGHALKQNPSKW